MTDLYAPLTKREWAISKGLAKPGRGRMPKAAHDAIEAERKATGIKFADDVSSVPVRPAERSEAEWVHPALTKSARAVQERLEALHENDLFAALTLRDVSFADKAGHRTTVTVTGRRELFWTGYSLTLGQSITMSTDSGWFTTPISRFTKIGPVNAKAKAADDIRLAALRAKKRSQAA